MSASEFIASLCVEADEVVRALLQRAYDHGFREGLASSGQPVTPVVPEPSGPRVEPVAQTSPARTDGRPPSTVRAEPVDARAIVAAMVDPPPDPRPVSWVGETEHQDVEAPADEEDDTNDGVVVRPILALATIGTLRRRIIRTFDLERFDIDVVICRSGDSDRRQLKTSVRLSSYRKEEG